LIVEKKLSIGALSRHCPRPLWLARPARRGPPGTPRSCRPGPRAASRAVAVVDETADVARWPSSRSVRLRLPLSAASRTASRLKSGVYVLRGAVGMVGVRSYSVSTKPGAAHLCCAAKAKAPVSIALTGAQCARDWTRTSTPFLAHAPQACVSTNSTTRAGKNSFASTERGSAPVTPVGLYNHRVKSPVLYH
jgi:hypothetical protein